MAVEQISVFIENKPGKLVTVLEVLGSSGIDMRAMTLADTADFGVLRLICDKPKDAKRVIEDAGFVASITEVLAVQVPDEPGGLTRILKVLSDGGLSIEYIYVFVTREKNKACGIIRVDDNALAEKVLAKNGISQIEKSEIYSE